jgi:hypothetical protein
MMSMPGTHVRTKHLSASKVAKDEWEAATNYRKHKVQQDS